MNDNPYLYALTTDPNKPLRDAQERIARLTAERDEARREVCQWEHHWDKTSSEQYYADKRGWDCYKEDKPCQ